MSDNRVTPRRGLGKGLGALIVNTGGGSNPPSDEVLRQAEDAIHLLEVQSIHPNPHQPRTTFDEALLQELAASIRTHGILQPLIVARDADSPHNYRLIAGERRWRAAQLAGVGRVPALIREASPQQLMEWALIENVQRADLNPLEEAAAFAVLASEFGLTQQQIAERVGKSRPAVANSLRLLDAPQSVQRAVTAARISAGHARALLSLKESGEIDEALDRVLSQELNVRQTEALVRSLLARSAAAATSPPQAQTHEPASHLRALEDHFRAGLGTKVNLSQNPDGSGRLVIHFFNHDDLQNLYETLVGGDSLT